MGLIVHNKLKYILDIGSSKISLIAAAKYGKSVRVIAEEEAFYDGYMDGEFLSADHNHHTKICYKAMLIA